QLLQWKQFEEEPSQSNVQMAKYFNSPCKSMRSMYSEEQIYHLLGENTSMRRLLTEKNAVIESLQEQVTNAKEKLVELLKSECSVEITKVSAISTSTLTINQHRTTTDETTATSVSRRPSTADPDGDINHTMVVQAAVINIKPPTEERGDCLDIIIPSPEPKTDNDPSATSKSVIFADTVAKSHMENIGRTVDGPSDAWEQLSRKVNYVSSEKLQEILKELSVETLSGCGQGSPRRQRRASHSAHCEAIPHPTEGFSNVCISLSPYITRRRRGQGYGRRSVLPAHYSRAVFPPPRCLIGTRDMYNGSHPLRDDAGDTRLDEANPERHHHHPSVQMKNTEIHDQENGGLWVTSLSEPLGSSKGSSHAVHWNHTGPAPHGTVTLRAQSFSYESDSSSSEETLCYCHRPYCDICSPPTCDSSDSCNTDTETADHLHGWSRDYSHTRAVINFKEDLTPTYV
ncbi:hypothetical protein GDO81_018913, partial [Engystomops pustulosus]